MLLALGVVLVAGVGVAAVLYNKMKPELQQIGASIKETVTQERPPLDYVFNDE